MKTTKYKLLGIAIVAISTLFILGADKALANCSNSNGQSVGNCATFIAQYAPGTVIAGTPFEAIVVMQNTGTRTWATGTYKLGSENPENNQTWGSNRWNLLAPVPPGAFATFALNLKAPSTPGQYNFQTRMVDDSFQWFGAYTPNKVIRVETATTVTRCIDGSITQLPDRCTGLPQVGVPGVPPLTCPAGHVGAAGICIAVCPSGQVGAGGQCITPPPAPGVNPNCSDCAEFIGQSVPSTMITGFSYPVTITERNTGMATWTAAQLYRLGSVNPNDNTTWGTHRVELPSSVPSGQPVTFRFNAIAPSTPGVYNFQWSMVHDGVWWFGGTTPNVVVTVIPPTVEALQAEIEKIKNQIIALLPTPCPNPQIGINGVICQTVPPPPTLQKPPPVVAALTPAFAFSNSSLQLNIIGSGFVPGATIRYNGIDKPTTFNSSTSLSAQLTTADTLASANTPAPKIVDVLNPAPCTGSCASNPHIFHVIPPPFLLTDASLPPNYVINIPTSTGSASVNINVNLQTTSSSPRTVTIAPTLINPSSGLTVTSTQSFACDIPAGGTTCIIPVTFNSTVSNKYTVTLGTTSGSGSQTGTITYIVNVAGPVGTYQVGDGCGSNNICFPDISAAVSIQPFAGVENVPVKVLSGNPQAIVFDNINYDVQQGTTPIDVSPFQVVFDQASSASPIGGCFVTPTFNSVCARLKIRVIDPNARDFYTLTFTALSAEGASKTFTVRVRVL